MSTISVPALLRSDVTTRCRHIWECGYHVVFSLSLSLTHTHTHTHNLSLSRFLSHYTLLLCNLVHVLYILIILDFFSPLSYTSVALYANVRLVYLFLCVSLFLLSLIFFLLYLVSYTSLCLDHFSHTSVAL